MPATLTKSRGDQILEGVNNNNLSDSLRRIMDACENLPKLSTDTEDKMYLQVSMETGLDMLQKEFHNPGLPLSEGRKMREISQFFSDWSTAYLRIAKGDRYIEPITAGKSSIGRIGKIMEYVSNGLGVLSNGTNGDNGNPMQYADRVNAAVNSIKWAKVHASERMYKNYVWFEIDSSFRSLSKDEQLKLLLNKESENFLRR